MAASQQYYILKETTESDAKENAKFCAVNHRHTDAVA
jgi:hypothetical protein